MAHALPCTPDPGASCWENTARIHRFAAPPGESGGALEADIRVAWQDGALLVRVGGLPAGASVELGVAPGPDDDGLRRLWPAEVGPGTHRLEVEPPLTPGTARSVRVSARVPGEDGGLDILPWAPAGPGDPLRAGILTLLEAPAPQLGLTVERRSGGLSAVAPGATRVRLEGRPPIVPSGSRGVPPPWSREGEDRAEGEPPDPGWVALQAEWHAPDGRLIDLARERLWWTPEPVELSREGLFPVPRSWESLDDAPWRPASGDRVCITDEAHEPAARLLVSELKRFTGIRAELGSKPGCAVRFMPLDELAPRLPAGDPHAVDAFGLRVTAAGVELGVTGDRTATWAALALADLVGPDGEAPAVALRDWPDVEKRVLYHAINLRSRPDWTPRDHVLFLERVVARGRYTDLVLAPYNSFHLPGAPFLDAPHTRPTEELHAVIDAARELGLQVWPGTTGLAHAGWMTASDGVLADDVTGELLDLRDGSTRTRAAEVLDALLDAFGGPEATRHVHLGHDEAMWKSGSRFGDERNPATAGSPRAVLLAESLRWHMDWARSRGLAPTIWSDTLLQGWNGGREGAWRSLELLDDADLRGLTVMSWAELGDPWTHLGARGVPVQRVHTGYVDWKREGLSDRLDTLDGEGLALFVPAPWAAHGPAPGRRNRFFHTSSVLLAGATAWRADLTGVSIARSLALLEASPGFLPGYALPGGPAGGSPGRSLVVRGGPAPGFVVLPRTLTVGGVEFETTHAAAARAGTPVEMVVDAPAVSLLIAAVVPHNAELPLLRAIRSGTTSADRAVAFVRLEADDAPPVEVPLVHGLDLFELDAAAWSAAMWRTQGSVALPSPTAAETDPGATDRRLWCRTLTRPDGRTITRATVHPSLDGITVLVGGATAASPAR